MATSSAAMAAAKDRACGTVLFAWRLPRALPGAVPAGSGQWTGSSDGKGTAPLMES